MQSFYSTIFDEHYTKSWKWLYSTDPTSLFEKDDRLYLVDYTYLTGSVLSAKILDLLFESAASIHFTGWG